MQTRTNWNFKSDGVRFNNRFPGARINHCERTGDRRYRILIKPENAPVNSSPWYAFKIRAKEKRAIEVTIRYHKTTHRYHPKASPNRIH